MRIEYEISNHPNHVGIKRKAVLKTNKIEYANNQSILFVDIVHYKENNDGSYGDEINTAIFKTIEYPLYGSNKKVDPLTGDFIVPVYKDADGNVVKEGDRTIASVEYPDYVTEFEFYKNFNPALAGAVEGDGLFTILEKVYAMVIAKRDSEGRFNQ
jgi:hypothetical protein